MMAQIRLAAAMPAATKPRYRDHNGAKMNELRAEELPQHKRHSGQADT